MHNGTRNPPSQVVPFSPKNGVDPQSGQVSFSAVGIVVGMNAIGAAKWLDL
jgi:hypothetical protein